MKRVIVVCAVSLASIPTLANAQTSSAPASTASTVTPDPSPPSASPPQPKKPSNTVQAPNDPRRKTDLIPARVQPNPDGSKIRFEADPVGDGALLGATIGFAGLTELVLSTGEIRPQQIDANFNTSNLLGIDRIAITQHIDPHAAAYSDIALLSAISFAVLDPILTTVRDGQGAGIVDAFMYAEAATTAWGLSDIAKVAVRRPRPIAYINRSQAIANGADPATYNNTSTDSSLSFFSGHAAVTSSIAGAATYLAFARSPHTARPWITLITGLALTSFVSFERVRAGAHFPTDVLAGAFAGAGIGLLVVHQHREDTVQQRPVWIGFAPQQGGGRATLSGYF